MIYGQSHYMLLTLQVNRLENALNDIEQMASGYYEIVSIIQQPSTSVASVLIRFEIAEIEPEFNEAEIRRKLGF